MKPLIVPGNLDSLALIRGYIAAAAAEAGLEKMVSYRLRLAVDELATNIINYGYVRAGHAGDVSVQADLDEQALVITLEDTAVPFDPRGREYPDQIDLPLEERPIGGLGVFLALESVDEFRYEYVGNRNRNILVVKRPAGLSN